MREIKFRAWDKRNNKWIHQDLFIVTNAGFYENHRAFEDGISLFDYEYELMQYTGLKDENGKEIYEGDILGKDAHWSFYIGFKDACFLMIPCNDVQRVNWAWHPIGQSMIDGWSVNGNIYENPELIK